nr:hypothetical protein GCM10020185_03230 [Pseudomonas brassicacearum subsp. brassicacearum]
MVHSSTPPWPTSPPNASRPCRTPRSSAKKSLTQKGTGLGLRQLDTSATQGGGPTLDTTLLGASGTHMAVVQIISRASDKAGHEALVKQIASGK